MTDDQPTATASAQNPPPTAKEERAIACADKIKQLLDEYSCRIDIYMTVGTDRSIRGIYKVVGK